MSVVKVEVELGSNQKGTLFVRCFRVKEKEVRIDLIDGSLVWCITVDESNTPPALDLAGTQYLEILESIFTVPSPISSDQDEKGNTLGYLFHWDTNSVLTLSQELELDAKKIIKTKFTALQFTPVPAKELDLYWNMFMKEIVSYQLDLKREREKMEHVAEERKRVILAKDVTVKAAIDTKAKLENHVFCSFIDLLNAKKERIEQLECEVHTLRSKNGNSSTKQPLSNN
ncbi:unnamed protein product [Albugo candida]|uniref:Uncharacterized protein n=1 Tax=Albugo candida TaxID=65357 RepID=A0A024GUH3_9STRA|nr:unnamed protein product [Albugo candida]|eukprot:CCI49994.1 unnamed protein product [Albugo candida]